MTSIVISAIAAFALGVFALRGLIYGVARHLESDDE
jgi:hypothetical protein